jgi:hypothetical protein
MDFDAVYLWGFRNTEVTRKRILRVVAAAANHLGDLLAACRLNRTAGADGAAVLLRSS